MLNAEAAESAEERELIWSQLRLDLIAEPARRGVSRARGKRYLLATLNSDRL
jgi:hypothetical protein